MTNQAPTEHELESPCGAHVAMVRFGQCMPSAVASGHRAPYYPATVTVTATDDPSRTVLVWKGDVEHIQVTFAADGRHLEILWHVAGCISGSSAARHFREVFHLPSGVRVVSACSDYVKDKETSSQPSPVGSKACTSLASILCSRLAKGYLPWKELEDVAELNDFLDIIADSGVDVSGSPATLRFLVGLLCRDLASWSDEEARMRLTIMKILDQIRVGSSKELVDLLVPLGRIREPIRDEHNRLVDQLGQRLLELDLSTYGATLRKQVTECLDGTSGDGSYEGGFELIEALSPTREHAAQIFRKAATRAQANADALAQAVNDRFGPARDADSRDATDVPDRP